MEIIVGLIYLACSIVLFLIYSFVGLMLLSAVWAFVKTIVVGLIDMMR